MIDYVLPSVEKSRKYWSVIDHISNGWAGIVEARETYMPKEESETPASYTSRHQKALFEDLFNPTINGIVGLIFKNPITYSDDIPTQLLPMIENADNAGNHMDIVIEKFFATALRKGIAFALTMLPKSDEVATKADEINQGIRPYITLIEPENIESWKTEIVNGQTVLSMVKIREVVQVEDSTNEYATKESVQWRVLYRGYYKVVTKGSDGKEQIIEEDLLELDYIPLVCLNLNARGFFQSFPPFFDLAMLNISHYQVSSDIRYSNHIATVPVLKLLGFDEDEIKNITISVNKAIRSNRPANEVDVSWLDYDGRGAEASERTLVRIEKRIMAMGLSMISEDKNMTATEANITGGQKQAKISKDVRLLVDAVELLFMFSAMLYGKKDGGGSIKIDADILSQPLSSEQLVALSNVVSQGNMSQITMWDMLKSGVFKLPADFDADTEKERINAEGLLLSANSGDINQE